MKHLTPPEHLDPEYLYKKYEPLRKAVHKKFRDRMSNKVGREDLMSIIDEIFIQLVMEYDPNRGVDFPYYIKKMLDLRTYHHVTKHLKTINSETLTEEEIVMEDTDFEDILQRIIDLNSIDPNIVLGDKHRKLMVGLLIERKTLKELAEEEGVPSDRLHARLYFLLVKMRKYYEENKDKYDGELPMEVF